MSRPEPRPVRPRARTCAGGRWSGRRARRRSAAPRAPGAPSGAASGSSLVSVVAVLSARVRGARLGRHDAAAGRSRRAALAARPAARRRAAWDPRTSPRPASTADRPADDRAPRASADVPTVRPRPPRRLAAGSRLRHPRDGHGRRSRPDVVVGFGLGFGGVGRHSGRPRISSSSGHGSSGAARAVRRAGVRRPRVVEERFGRRGLRRRRDGLDGRRFRHDHGVRTTAARARRFGARRFEGKVGSGHGRPRPRGLGALGGGLGRRPVPHGAARFRLATAEAVVVARSSTGDYDQELAQDGGAGETSPADPRAQEPPVPLARPLLPALRGDPRRHHRPRHRGAERARRARRRRPRRLRPATSPSPSTAPPTTRRAGKDVKLKDVAASGRIAVRGVNVGFDLDVVDASASTTTR